MKIVHKGWRGGAALVALAACGPLPEEAAPVDRVTAPIIAGRTNTGDPAIVEHLALISPTQAGICTATLVSPRVLLTAAHCVAEHPQALHGVFFGASNVDLDAGTFVPALAAVFNPAYSIDNPALEHDLAVVILTAPAPMAPVPMNRAPLGPEAIGQPARYVGYGLSDGVNRTGSGIKRETTQALTEVQRSYLRIGANPNGACNGDSGGPLLMTFDGVEKIVGVVSFGDDQHCENNSYFQRLDTQIAWVDEQIQKYDPTTPAPPVMPPATPPAMPGDATPPAVAQSPDSGAPPPIDPEPPAPMPPAAPVPPPPAAAAMTDAGAEPAIAPAGPAVPPEPTPPAPVASATAPGDGPGLAPTPALPVSPVSAGASALSAPPASGGCSVAGTSPGDRPGGGGLLGLLGLGVLGLAARRRPGAQPASKPRE